MNRHAARISIPSQLAFLPYLAWGKPKRTASFAPEVLQRYLDLQTHSPFKRVLSVIYGEIDRYLTPPPSIPYINLLLLHTVRTFCVCLFFVFAEYLPRV